MGYNYGDKRTAGNGIWLWLQGHRNFSDEQKPNYIPKNLDINQKSNWVRDTILTFLQIPIDKKSKRDYHFKSSQYDQKIQKRFKEYCEFIKLNYEEQK